MFFCFFCSEATATAALKGQVAWSNAMEGATKVRDAYSRRSHELSQALVKVWKCVFFWGGVGREATAPRINIEPEVMMVWKMMFLLELGDF